MRSLASWASNWSLELALLPYVLRLLVVCAITIGKNLRYYNWENFRRSVPGPPGGDGVQNPERIVP